MQSKTQIWPRAAPTISNLLLCMLGKLRQVITLRTRVPRIRSGLTPIFQDSTNISKWFKFNDHSVTLASKSQVLNEEAFLLFYVIQSLA